MLLAVTYFPPKSSILQIRGKIYIHDKIRVLNVNLILYDNSI